MTWLIDGNKILLFFGGVVKHSISLNNDFMPFSIEQGYQINNKLRLFFGKKNIKWLCTAIPPLLSFRAG